MPETKEKGPMIYEAIAKIMADVPAIGKDSENRDQHYKFRGIDAVYNTLHALFAKHKVFVRPEALESRSGKFTSKNGRTTHHTREFRIREKSYPESARIERELSIFARKAKLKNFFKW